MDLALVDFDHTVTTCDTYSRFLRSVATPAQLSTAKWTVGPWLLGYRLRLVSAAALRTHAPQLTFAGRDAGEIEAAGGRHARDTLPGVLRPEMMERIGWHQERGDTVVIVSASLDTYMQPWCDAHGLALLCNRLEAVDGRLTGRYLGGDRGPYKVADIHSRYDLASFDRVHAYGDSSEDKPMLALAQERWWRGKRVA